jgi:monofunctional glycosyltransferase
MIGEARPVAGAQSARAGMASRQWLKGRLGRVARVIVITLLVLVVLPYLIAPFYRVINPVSTLMLWRWATFQPVERTWVPLADISPNLALAVIVAEDGRFCAHRGIDTGELLAAIREVDDLSDARGGSTITQQVAKNLFLWGSRSYVRKALELPLALWIDLVLPKRRILEIYLNIAEWGPDGEFGAEAGARHAFNRSATQLSAGQAALMAATLPNPHQRNAGQPTAAMRRLAGIHQRRMAIMARNDACLRPERRAEIISNRGTSQPERLPL